MSEKIRKSRWKTILTLVTFAALVATGYVLREQITETILSLRHANPWPILLIIPLTALNHYSQGRVYRSIFGILGDKFRTKAMMRLSLEMNFVNNVFPSAGVSGFSYLSFRMKPEDISAGKATLVQVMRFALLFVSFQVLLALGLLLLAFSGRVSSFVMLIAGSLATLLLVGTLMVLFIISNQSRLNAFFTALTKFLNRFINIFRPRNPETINIARVQRIFRELHDNYKLLKQHVSDLKTPLRFALLFNLCEVLAILAVFFAFGQFVNPGAVIIAYAVANFAGIMSVLPGGIGVYEGLMTGVFAAAGVPPGISLPVIVAFRIVSMVAQIPIGYYFYQKTLQYEHPRIEQ